MHTAAPLADFIAQFTRAERAKPRVRAVGDPQPFTTEGGVAGFRVVEERQGAHALQHMIGYLFEKRDRKYVLICCAPADGGEAYDPIFDQVARSFRMDR